MIDLKPSQGVTETDAVMEPLTGFTTLNEYGKVKSFILSPPLRQLEIPESIEKYDKYIDYPFSPREELDLVDDNEGVKNSIGTYSNNKLSRQIRSASAKNDEIDDNDAISPNAIQKRSWGLFNSNYGAWRRRRKQRQKIKNKNNVDSNRNSVQVFANARASVKPRVTGVSQPVPQNHANRCVGEKCSRQTNNSNKKRLTGKFRSSFRSHIPLSGNGLTFKPIHDVDKGTHFKTIHDAVPRAPPNQNHNSHNNRRPHHNFNGRPGRNHHVRRPPRPQKEIIHSLRGRLPNGVPIARPSSFNGLKPESIFQSNPSIGNFSPAFRGNVPGGFRQPQNQGSTRGKSLQNSINDYPVVITEPFKDDPPRYLRIPAKPNQQDAPSLIIVKEDANFPKTKKEFMFVNSQGKQLNQFNGVQQLHGSPKQHSLLRNQKMPFGFNVPRPSDVIGRPSNRQRNSLKSQNNISKKNKPGIDLKTNLIKDSLPKPKGKALQNSNKSNKQTPSSNTIQQLTPVKVFLDPQHPNLAQNSNNQFTFPFIQNPQPPATRNPSRTPERPANPTFTQTSFIIPPANNIAQNSINRPPNTPNRVRSGNRKPPNAIVTTPEFLNKLPSPPNIQNLPIAPTNFPRGGPASQISLTSPSFFNPAPPIRRPTSRPGRNNLPITAFPPVMNDNFLNSNQQQNNRNVAAAGGGKEPINNNVVFHPSQQQRPRTATNTRQASIPSFPPDTRSPSERVSSYTSIDAPAFAGQEGGGSGSSSQNVRIVGLKATPFPDINIPQSSQFPISNSLGKQAHRVGNTFNLLDDDEPSEITLKSPKFSLSLQFNPSPPDKALSSRVS